MYTNRKAQYDFHIISKIEAGIVLQGSEIKSLRNGDFAADGSYCFISGNSVILKGFIINEYDKGGAYSHEPSREKILLLKKKQVEKLKFEMETERLSIIPTKIYFNKKGKVKVEVALVKGKKNYDKRESIKKRDIQKSFSQKETFN